jgi:carboxymethylenebutenolidase
MSRLGTGRRCTTLRSIVLSGLMLAASLGAQFDTVAAIFVPAGYVVFAPMRRGHGYSEGEYIQDLLQSENRRGQDAVHRILVEQMEGPQLDDQLAGQAFVKSLPYVDKTRLVVAGWSYGGIQTLLAAERGAGYRAAVAISPAAESWAARKPLQDRLIKAVGRINIPVFIIQPQKDANVTPGYTLGLEFQRQGKPYGLEIFPPFGPEDETGHCFGGAKGMHIWAQDALRFIADALRQ